MGNSTPQLTDLWFSIPFRKYQTPDGLKTIENYQTSQGAEETSACKEGRNGSNYADSSCYGEVVAGRASYIVVIILLGLKMKGETVERTAIAKSDAGLCSCHSYSIKDKWTIVTKVIVRIVPHFNNSRLRPCWWWHQDAGEHGNRSISSKSGSVDARS